VVAAMDRRTRFDAAAFEDHAIRLSPGRRAERFTAEAEDLMFPNRAIAIIISFALWGASAAGQTAQTQTYEPKVGQPGKDVVWVPTSEALVEKMLDMAKVTSPDVVIDLGSGDGRTVIAAAKRGATAIGVEYNPDMVALSQANVKRAGVAAHATIVHGDIFEYDFSKANVVTMFLLPTINMKLRPKILEMRPGTRIVTNSFTMEDWEADQSETVSQDCASWCTANLWIVPAKVDGTWQMRNGTLTVEQRFQKFSGMMGTTAATGGKLHGTELEFTLDGVKYTGSVNGNSMNGTTVNGQSWTATRK
jgi:precorrin-6B methylase 2